jgi:NAD(P)-dependent dehydrogenase (short-subunit alcohol dehydrogenase family)
MNFIDLSSKNILISGASSGIGRACAFACNSLGANVILLGRDQKRLDATLASLKGENNRAYSIDITNYELIPGVIENAVHEVGRISGFIHSAGVELTQSFQMTDPLDFENIYALNVVAGYELAKHCIKKRHIHFEGASLVFISSIRGILGGAGNVAYCSSKGALISGVKALALEYASKNIRVNCISPAIVQTEMVKTFFANLSDDSIEKIISLHPLGLGLPEDVADAAVFLLSERARWITGSNLIVDGGYSA